MRLVVTDTPTYSSCDAIQSFKSHRIWWLYHFARHLERDKSSVLVVLAASFPLKHKIGVITVWSQKY